MTEKATIYTIRTPHDRAEIGKRLELVPIPRDGLDVTLRKHREPIDYHKLKRVKAHLYDIARYRAGTMKPPKRVFIKVCDDFKRTDIWPRYSNPDPDTFTGEVLYKPKHTNDLTDAEEAGVIQWLQHYMNSNGIPSHARGDNWKIPEPIEDAAIPTEPEWEEAA